MKLEDFEVWVRCRWAEQTLLQKRPPLERLAIIALGVGGEAGEIQEHVKKHIRDGRVLYRNLEFLRELGDCLHYLTRLSQEFGFSLEEVASENVSKLEARDEKKFAKQLDRPITET